MIRDNNKILVFIDYYLPGYKGGGPVNTLSNMVSLLAEEYEFYIVTRDRDLGSAKPYPNIEYDRWVMVDGAKVMYLAPNDIKLSTLYKIIQSQEWREIYLNSFFSAKFSISIILLKKIFGVDAPILLSPKGEFSPGALKLKSIKKKAYLLFAKLFGLYKDVTWHLTDVFELEALKHIFNKNVIYKVVRDPIVADKSLPFVAINKDSGLLRLVFVSRISKMKNLDVCLKVLGKLDKDIVFDIYGPIEDEDYWDYCQSLISNLPENVKVKYCGELLHDEVCAVIAKYHVFFLPTAGENFGYVIFEALFAGRPVLIGSDTPWKNLKEKNIGADIDPEYIDGFVSEINRFVQMDQDEFNEMAKSCREYAVSLCDEDKQKEAVKDLFV